MASDADAQHVRDGLNLFNVGRTGHDYWRPVKLFIRDSTGLIRGGLLGDIWGGWLEVKIFWIEESLRRSGLGRRLMEAAETEAQQAGCRYVRLGSHSFQAPDFYKKLGYEESTASKTHPLATNRSSYTSVSDHRGM